MIYISGPGHGGNAMVAQDWLDGSYQEVLRATCITTAGAVRTG